uniref:Uncharacterized protein n=1 Tax=Panagrolaimus superbus TaxID=310955 RepID=A0A914YIS5_9BILA
MLLHDEIPIMQVKLPQKHMEKFQLDDELIKESFQASENEEVFEFNRKKMDAVLGLYEYSPELREESKIMEKILDLVSKMNVSPTSSTWGYTVIFHY